MTITTNVQNAIAQQFDKNANIQMIFGSVFAFRQEFESASSQLGNVTKSKRAKYLSAKTSTTVPMNKEYRAAVFDAMVEVHADAKSGKAAVIKKVEDNMYEDMVAKMMADPDFDMSAFA